MIDIGQLLCRELGASRVILPSSERIDDYGRDESSLGRYLPDCAVLCDDRRQVAAVLALAAEHRVPVTPRGAGSGTVGGCLPVRGGIVLSVENMTGIVDVATHDLVAVTRPGTITGDLQAAVEDEGLFYPPDPASLGVCSIGGNVATNAGGARAFKYGVTREYVLGLEVVLMGGEILRIGRRTSKGVTGYDLVGSFVGSEGSFGVITEVTLKLRPKPEAVATMLVVFPTLVRASEAITALLGKGLWPRTLEIADRTTVDHVRPHARYRFPEAAGAVVLVELDGASEGLEGAMMRAGQVCEDMGAVDVIVAQSETQRRELWEARRMMSPCLRRAHRHKVSEDICVPRGKIPGMVARLDRVATEFDLPIACFGHAGDGNLHVNILVDQDPEDPDVAARIEATVAAIFHHTIELGGTLSGEHGIGIAKKRFMPLEMPGAVLDWHRRLKRMWDPLQLLNPGKVVPARRAPWPE